MAPMTSELPPVSDAVNFNVQVAWDEDAGVWFVQDTDVPGLVAEADDLDTLVKRLIVLVPEMLELNGVVQPDHGLPDVPFNLISRLKGERLPH